jgi:hypothetical protein
MTSSDFVCVCSTTVDVSIYRMLRKTRTPTHLETSMASFALACPPDHSSVSPPIRGADNARYGPGSTCTPCDVLVGVHGCP